jgi:hypothetical protein
MKLKGLLVPTTALTEAQHAEMFALMERHYENVTRAAFSADLAEKHWVILLLDPRTEALCGFSTQRLLDVAVSGRPVKALFSGDTIVARDHWGDSALAHVWGRLALSLIDGLTGAELYWFLISKGYKTYRFLPLFFHEFYPRHDKPTPAWAGTAIDALGSYKFPGAYDPLAGVVRAGPGKDRLRRGVADLSPERLHDPHVRFFAERNPGHARGDELCCLAPLTRANFTAAAYRVIGPEPVPLEVMA